MIDTVYFRQAELLLRVLPLVDREAVFALKGGTAINFFVRDLPRVSVDIDLVYLPVGERDLSLREISDALVRISRDVESRIPGTKIVPKKIKGIRSLERMFGSTRGCDDQDRAESGHARLALSPGTQDPVPEGPELI